MSSTSMTITDGSYTGTAAQYMVAQAVIACDTLEKGVVNLDGDIAKEKTIPVFSLSASVMQKHKQLPALADAKGDADISGRKLTPVLIDLFDTLDPLSLRQHFFAEAQHRQNSSLLDPEFPDAMGSAGVEFNFSSFIVSYYLKTMMAQFENLIWRGRKMFDPDGLNTLATSKGETADAQELFYIDGFIYKSLSDATVKKVASPSAITKANIIAKMTAAYALVPKALKFKFGANGLKFLMSVEDAILYQEALEDGVYKNQNTTETGIFKFRGMQIENLAGLPKDTFYIAVANDTAMSNLHVGLNASEDLEAIKFSKYRPEGTLWFIKATIACDVNHSIGKELVIHTTITV